MTLIDRAAALTDEADLIILANVETIRDQNQPATASAIASLIGGSPVLAILKRIHKMENMGLVEPHSVYGVYQLTEMGCELLRRELVGWSPSAREQARRDKKLRRAFGGGELRL
jgi:repressor of nif and glnA expression